MNRTEQEKNKALVLEAFDTLFNKRDYAAAERFWSPAYIQHSAHIAPSREGLFNLVKSLPPTLKYEPAVIVAEGDVVIVHGRFSDFGLPVNWIAARKRREGHVSKASNRYRSFGSAQETCQNTEKTQLMRSAPILW